MVCCVLFLSVIYDNQKTIREECYVRKLPCNYNQVSSRCLTTQWRIQTFRYRAGGGVIQTLRKGGRLVSKRIVFSPSGLSLV